MSLCLGGCGTTVSRKSTSGYCRPCSNRFRAAITKPADAVRIDGIATPPEPGRLLEADKLVARLTVKAASATAKYTEALKQVESLEKALGVMDALKACGAPQAIRPKFGSGTSEAMPWLVASDWHSEERVDPRKINHLNAFSLEIADLRIERFWQASERLVRLLKQDVKVPTVGVALLGDFITGQIHGAENAEANQLLPTEAICWVQDRIVAGLELLLSSYKGDVLVVCHSGNHSRTTQQNRLNGNENGHSLELLLYVHLLTHFRNEKRITINIAEGYHTFQEVYGKTIRFHHGHSLRYGGGRGGLFTPTYDAIDNWNKAKRADLDVFGHFHQMRDGGNFLCNGSLIGYNGFAQRIKASYEEPKQTLFLMDKKRGRTCTWPVYLERK